MRVVICGAGIAGLAAAKFLSEQGSSVLLLEKAEGLRTSGYMIDFAGSGYDAVVEDGLLHTFKSRAQNVKSVRYVNAKGRTRSRLDYMTARAAMNGRLLPMLRGDIEEALFSVLPNRVDMRYGTTIERIYTIDGRVEMGLSDGSDITADLLIGADGIHSRVRSMVFGEEEDFLRYLGFHTAAFVFHDEKLAKEARNQLVMYSIPNHQIGYYGIGGDKLATFFAFKSADTQRPEHPRAALHAAYLEAGWRSRQLLHAADQCDEIYYDVVAQVEMKQWHKGRVILLGDSGAAVSLLAGQGASLAVGGAYMLAQYLARYDIDKALETYEKALRPEIENKQASGRAMAKWFIPPTEMHNFARDVFFNLTNVPGVTGLFRPLITKRFDSILRK